MSVRVRFKVAGRWCDRWQSPRLPNFSVKAGEVKEVSEGLAAYAVENDRGEILKDDESESLCDDLQEVLEAADESDESNESPEPPRPRPRRGRRGKGTGPKGKSEVLG